MLCWPHIRQPLGHAFPALCRARVGRVNLLLDPRPSLLLLRRRSSVLVRRFISTMPRSDSSETYIRAVRPKPSPVGLLTAPASTRSPGSRAVSIEACLGLRLRRTVRELALPLPSVLPSAQSDSVGVLIAVFRSSYPAHLFPSFYASRHASRHTAQNSGPSGSLLPSREEFSSSASCRFIPALPDISPMSAPSAYHQPTDDGQLHRAYRAGERLHTQQTADRACPLSNSRPPKPSPFSPARSMVSLSRLNLPRACR